MKFLKGFDILQDIINEWSSDRNYREIEIDKFKDEFQKRIDTTSDNNINNYITFDGSISTIQIVPLPEEKPGHFRIVVPTPDDMNVKVPSGQYPLPFFYDDSYRFPSRRPFSENAAEEFRLMRIGDYCIGKCF